MIEILKNKSFSFRPEIGTEIFAHDGSLMGTIVNHSINRNFVVVDAHEKESWTCFPSSAAPIPANLAGAVVAWDIVPGLLNGSLVAVAGAAFAVPASGWIFSSSTPVVDDEYEDVEWLHILVDAPEGSIDPKVAGLLFLRHESGEEENDWSRLADILPAEARILVCGVSRKWLTVDEFRSLTAERTREWTATFAVPQATEDELLGVDTAECCRILAAREAAKKAQEE